ncbi:MAG: hypothetical protein R2685_11975 [Candidatus Nitrosocosmicus sp.]|nr:hypothetical protein [Candidatus Nitrosocosmicus sp.]
MIDRTSDHNSVSLVTHLNYLHMTRIGDYWKIYNVRNNAKGENDDGLESLDAFFPSLFSGINQHVKSRPI